MKYLSKNRAQLLGIFITNPDKAFYMQELGRILGKKPGVFQRTINNMVTEGILESEHKANSRYFKINKSYPLLKELKGIVLKTTGIYGNLGQLLDKIGHIKFGFIYGSYAKGKENYLSDIDLLIVGSPDENNLISALDKLEERLQRQINYKLYSLADFKKYVSEKDPFLISLLKGKIIMVVGDENELRKIFNGQTH